MSKSHETATDHFDYAELAGVSSFEVFRGVVVAGLVSVAACVPTNRAQADADNGLYCGPGTIQVGNVCLGARPDAGPPDAYVPADGHVKPIDAPRDAAIDARPDAPPDARPDAPPDANLSETEATSFGINPAHDNAQPSDSVATPLTPAWTATFNGHVSYPLVVGGMVIVAAAESQPNVRALDIHTGALVWGPIVFGTAVTLAYDGGRVFALDRDGHLAALDVLTGTHAWAIQVESEPFYWSPPVASGGLVYVNGLGEGGETVAIDEHTGIPRWSNGTFDGTEGSVAVAGNVVYEAEACDQLSAWNAATGADLWFHSGNCTGGGGAAPAVHNGLIWERDWAEGNVIIDTAGHSVGSFAASAVPAFDADTVFYEAQGTVSAVDIMTDTLRWSFSGDGQLCTSPVVAGAGGQVFVGSQSGKVYELDATTGVQRSVHALGAAVTCFSESDGMAVAGGHLIVPAGNQLVVY